MNSEPALTADTIDTAEPTVSMPRPPSPSRPSPLLRHRLDPVALLIGAVFLTVGAARLGDRMGWMHVDNRVWFGTAMVTLGAIALVTMSVYALRPPGRRTATRPGQDRQHTGDTGPIV